jgi:hypothetical protein
VDCDRDPAACRRRDIASPLNLVPNPRSPGDYEGKCPECGHGGFALSAATRSRHRNIWSCNCRRCNGGKGCDAGTIRAAMLRKDIPAWCLGTYDGAGPGAIEPERARTMSRTITDILSAPGLRPSDMRIMLAEAQGALVPEEASAFVKFAIAAGVGRRQAYEAATRWCRPAGLSSPHPGEGVVDTSRSSQPGRVVKPSRSEPRKRADSAQNGGSGSAETARIPGLPRAESARTTNEAA